MILRYCHWQRVVVVVEVEVVALLLCLLDHIGGLTQTDLPETLGEDGNEGYDWLTSLTGK